MRAKIRTVFLSVCAQHDNLGDIAIRQACIDLVGGVPIVAFAGNMPTTYVEAFNFPPGAQVATSRLAFARSFVGSLLGRRAHLMLAPGPRVLSRGSGHLKSLATLLGVQAVRLFGGSVVAVGQSIRGTGSLGKAIQLAIARRCAVFATRDLESSRVLGVAFDRCPDLALRVSGVACASDRVVLSFRGDRYLDDEWVAELVERLREDGLDPVFVTQVERDDERHRRWASQLSVEVVAWDNHSHREQMKRVRVAIADAVGVVSDRLHAVIFGLQVGATPVVVLRTSPDKVVTALGDLVPLQLLDPEQVLCASPEWRAAGQRRSDLDLGLAAARRDLDDLGLRIAAVFGGIHQEHIRTKGSNVLTKECL